MGIDDVQNSQTSRSPANPASVAMSQASWPQRAQEPSVAMSQPSFGGARGASSAHTGRKIDGFEILTLISSGAFGEVYEARHPGLGFVAVKIGPQIDPRRFEREVAALQGVTHPHLIKFHAGGTFNEGGREHFWLAMEYPGPVTLAELIAAGPLPPTFAIAVYRQILDALLALHNAALIHRDLKPANILVNDGKVKLIDFGLTKSVLATAQEGLTLTGQIVGTPRYMSPEQVNGMREVGPASDVWSSVVIFYEMLTGRPLFDGTNEMQLGAQILGRDLEAQIMSQSIPVFLRPWFLEFLDRAEPANRCSVGQLQAAFDRAVAQFVQREDDVHSRAAWHTIRERKIIEELFKSGPPSDLLEFEKSFVAKCHELNLNVPPQEEVKTMTSAAFEAFGAGGLERLSAELGGQFRKIKTRTIEDQESKSRVGRRDRGRAYTWFAASALFGCICLVGFVLIASNDKQKKPKPDPVQIALGVVGMLGGGLLCGLCFYMSAKSWLAYTNSLPGPSFDLEIPSWESCPGRFFCFEKGMYWESREQLPAGAQRFEYALELGFEAAPLISDMDLHVLLPLTRLAVLRLNRCKRVTDRAMEVVAHLPGLKWLDASDTLLTDAAIGTLLSRVYPARLDLAGCVNLKPVVAGYLAEARIYELDLGFNEWVGAASMRTLSSNVSLRSLSLAGCRNLDDAAVEFLSQLALKTLNMRWCDKVTDKGLAALGNIQFLENLDLRGMPAITDAGIRSLTSLKYLKLLHLSDCARLTQHGIDELCRAIPFCRIDTCGEFELPRYLY